MAQLNSEGLTIGEVFLNKYEIRGLIGKGGQAAVYHGYDAYLDRDVAIKVMTNPPDSNREHNRRAQLEARVLCKFQHANIVQVYDAGMTDTGVIYIIMELLKGRTLRDALRKHHKLSVYEALQIGAQIADGVEVAHGQQVIHRDLKPENIFILNNNAVKVLDFGIAKFLTLTGVTTQRDMLQGTMWYISPEHVQGLGVTVRSDIYALGSLLYEAIAGTPPCLMNLQEITTQSVAWSQISRVPPQLDTWVSDVPAHVGRLVQRMLVKDPGQRQQSMSEVAEAFRAACKRVDVEQGAAVSSQRELWHDVEEASGLVAQADIEHVATYNINAHFQHFHDSTKVTQDAMSVAAATLDSSAILAEQTKPVVDDTTATSSSLASSRPSRSRRWQVVLAAIGIGAIVGLILGLRKGVPPSSPAAVPSVQAVAPPPIPRASSTLPRTPEEATPPATASKAQVAPSIANLPSVGTASASSSSSVPALPGKATTSGTVKPSRTKNSQGAQDKQNTSDKGTTEGPKPKFGGSDLD